MVSIFKSTILFVIFTLTAQLAFAQTSSLSQSSCLSFYSSFKTNRQIWLSEPRAIGDSVEARYSPSGRVVQLKEAPITNQCRTSECYLFSVINYINVNNINTNQNGAHEVVISEPFLVAHKFLQHIREGIWYGPSDTRVIHDLKGGFAYEAVHLTRQVGLVPKGTWEPLIPFEEWNMNEIYSTLETKIPEWHNYIRSLAQQYGSYEAAPVRDAEREGNQQLRNFILGFTGHLPESFSYKDLTFTPKEFEKVVGLPRGRILTIDNNVGYGVPEGAKAVLDEAMVNHGGSWKYQVGDFESIINNSLRFVEAGHPVIFDFGWKDGGHSMLLVGYEANSQNQIVRLKLMNSWGKNFGNDGYAWYTLQDVWNHVYRTYKLAKLAQ